MGVATESSQLASAQAAIISGEGAESGEGGPEDAHPRRMEHRSARWQALVRIKFGRLTGLRFSCAAPMAGASSATSVPRVSC
jgi:hypothetical protein